MESCNTLPFSRLIRIQSINRDIAVAFPLGTYLGNSQDICAADCNASRPGMHMHFHPSLTCSSIPFQVPVRSGTVPFLGESQWDGMPDGAAKPHTSVVLQRVAAAERRRHTYRTQLLRHVGPLIPHLSSRTTTHSAARRPPRVSIPYTGADATGHNRTGREGDVTISANEEIR